MEKNGENTSLAPVAVSVSNVDFSLLEQLEADTLSSNDVFISGNVTTPTTTIPQATEPRSPYGEVPALSPLSSPDLSDAAEWFTDIGTNKKDTMLSADCPKNETDLFLDEPPKQSFGSWSDSFMDISGFDIAS